jgi:hypothetical protein
MRCENLNRLCKPVVTILLLTIFITLLAGNMWKAFFTGEHRQNYVTIFCCLIWGLISKFKPKRGPWVLYITQVLFVLNWYDRLEHLQEDDSREAELRILMLIIVL